MSRAIAKIQRSRLADRLLELGYNPRVKRKGVTSDEIVVDRPVRWKRKVHQILNMTQTRQDKAVSGNIEVTTNDILPRRDRVN